MAAGCVVLGHLLPSGSLVDRFALANLAVVFFFSLSAFLMSYVLSKQLEATGSIDVRRYYLNRFLRIWPLYLASLVFVFVMFGAYGPFKGGEFDAPYMDFQWLKELNVGLFLFFFNLDNAAYLPDLFALGKVPGQFGGIWSINVEEQAYLVMPLVFLLSVRLRQRWLLLALCLSAMAYRTYLMQTGYGENPHASRYGMYFHTISYVEVLVIAGMAGRVAALGQLRPPQVNGAGGVFLLLFLGLGWVWTEGLWPPYPLWATLMYPVLGALFAAFLLYVVWFPHGLTGRVLRSKPLMVLGTLSFGTYLLHVPGFTLARFVCYDIFGVAFKNPNYPLVYYPLAIVVVLVLAVLGHLVVERPFLSLKENLARKI